AAGWTYNGLHGIVAGRIEAGRRIGAGGRAPSVALVGALAQPDVPAFGHALGISGKPGSVEV
nr:hypothetical protein [Tanacetum cinerariifolium]